MLLRTLALCAALLLGCTQADARVHRGRPHEYKNFPANHDSVLLENVAADAMGARRYYTEREVTEAVWDGELVPLTGLWVAKQLPPDRRYALPATVEFAQELSYAFEDEFGQHLILDSAVRPATVQQKLGRRNRCAAPAYGERASSHERGTTIDISRHMTKPEYRWLVVKLLYYRAIGRILVIEERACFHIFVKGNYGVS